MGSRSTNLSSYNDESWHGQTNRTFRTYEKVYFNLLDFYLLKTFFCSIKSFENLREDVLSKLADTLDEVSYAEGEFIVRQGAKGDTFYIVAKGKIVVIYY
jgi:hypothetical protein